MAEYLAPRVGTGMIRSPTTTQQDNGRMVNFPRFAGIGGLDSPSKLPKPRGNSMALSKPGDTK